MKPKGKVENLNSLTTNRLLSSPGFSISIYLLFRNAEPERYFLSSSFCVLIQRTNYYIFYESEHTFERVPKRDNTLYSWDYDNLALGSLVALWHRITVSQFPCLLYKALILVLFFFFLLLFTAFSSIYIVNSFVFFFSRIMNNPKLCRHIVVQSV